ncbi:MAG: hypothetical protein M0R22_08115 [Dehalococcoidia bacterium]|nr:hypothetical protein [Dehalococcoidia bacterium]
MSVFDTDIWRAIVELDVAEEPFWREYTDRVMRGAIADFERALGIEPLGEGEGQ